MHPPLTRYRVGRDLYLRRGYETDFNLPTRLAPISASTIEPITAWLSEPLHLLEVKIMNFGVSGGILCTNSLDTRTKFRHDKHL